MRRCEPNDHQFFAHVEVQKRITSTGVLLLLQTNKQEAHFIFELQTSTLQSMIAILLLFLAGSSPGQASWNNPVRKLQVDNDQMGSFTTTSFALLLNFFGRPEGVDNSGLQLIATNFAAAYENAEQIARIVGTAPFLRQLEGVQVEAPLLGTATSESLIPYSLLLRVNASCDTCEERLPLFSNITAPRFFFPYDPWFGPSMDEVVYKFNQMMSGAIDELVTAQQLSPIECSNDVTEFETDVLIDFVGDVGQATGDEILALSNAFQATYNVLNGVTNEGLCDRSFREVVGVSIDINQAQNRRSLQTGGVLGSFPGFNGTVFRPFTLFARIQARCRNCPINTQIFDDDAGRRRRHLEGDDGVRKKLEQQDWLLRRLQSSSGDCFCSMNAQEFRAPSRTEFTEAFNTTVQVLAASNAVRFIAAVDDEVIEVDPITCSSDVVFSETNVAVNVTGAGDNITTDSSLAIEEEFANTYNALAQTTCDPFFRTLVNVTLVTVVVEEEERRSLRNHRRHLMAPRGNVTAPLTLFLRIRHRCRKCPLGTGIFGEDAGRRRLLEVKQQSTVFDPFIRNLQEGQNDTCYCDTDFTIADAPPPSDFVVAYETNLLERNVEGIGSVEAIEEDVEIPLTIAPFAPTTSPPTSSPIMLPVTIPPTTSAPVDATALPSQGTTTVTTVPPPTECICPDLPAAGPPPNDNCAQFQSIQIGGSPVIGSTVGATQETRADDVHYGFIGNGRRVRISTCFGETTTAHNFVLRNGGCSQTAFGETFSDPACRDNVNAAAYEFDSVAGTFYPINVYPRNPGVEGQFSIQVTDFVNPPNDYCSQYESLEIGGSAVTGTTVNATRETRADDVHYGFVGNGRRVRISTCFAETTTAHNFVLRNGGCSRTAFGETFSDPACRDNVNAVAYEFDSVALTVYPINVYPRNPGVEGQFAIQVTDFVNPPNDYCPQYESLQIGGSPVTGTTVNATRETRADDVHYGFIGNGRRVRISTCFAETTTAHNFVLRNGGCSQTAFGETFSDPACRNNVNAAAYEFDSVAGTFYPINVYPRNPGVEGQFAIQVIDFVNPPNDDCSMAQILTIGGAQVIGTTSNATDDSRANNVHYAFVGNGLRVRVSTCFEETTTAHNFVLRNGGCSQTAFGETLSDPDCVDNVNAAAFEFDSVAGTSYPINVYPRNRGLWGQFAIRVSEVVRRRLLQPVSIPEQKRLIDESLDQSPPSFLDDAEAAYETPRAAEPRFARQVPTHFPIPTIDFLEIIEADVDVSPLQFITARRRLVTTPMLPCVCPARPNTSPSYNDNCLQYQSLEVGLPPLIGTTSNATRETRADDVHYGFVGNGRRVRISTCFEETTTAHNFVLRNGGCSRTAFGETFSDPACTGNGNAAAYEFDSVAGTFYPINVYPRSPGVEGQFAIQVTDFVNPPNDYCTQYESLEIGGSPVTGTTVNATRETRADDVHYSFVGNGRRVRISTCFAETTTAHNFVLRNGGCSRTAFGETVSDPACIDNVNAAAYEFDSVAGTFYPINVYPRNPGVEGQFAIQVTTFVIPPNDYCSQYESLQIGGFPVTGTTVNATRETRADDVHYGFVGNGRRVRISTCFAETTTAHNFVLRNGGCSRTAFGETVSDPACASNVNAVAYEFDSVALTVYPINVYPRNPGVEGQFAIQVTDFVNPPNDYCPQYESLQIGGSSVIGTTVNATRETRADDVHYGFVGNGRRVRISTCFAETTTAHNFVLRNGGCSRTAFGETFSDPTCTGNADAAAYEFDSVAGTFYPINVYPRNPGERGQFAIQVTEIG